MLNYSEMDMRRFSAKPKGGEKVVEGDLDADHPIMGESDPDGDLNTEEYPPLFTPEDVENAERVEKLPIAYNSNEFSAKVVFATFVGTGILILVWLYGQTLINWLVFLVRWLIS